MTSTPEPSPPLLAAAVARPARTPDVAVLGDGLGGLVTAHYLLAAGRTPVVVPAPEPGRERLRSVAHRGAPIDLVHSPIRASDTATLGLLHDLGLSHRIRWHETATRDLPSGASPLTRARGELADAWLRSRSRRPWRTRGQGALAAVRRIAGDTALEALVVPRLEACLGEIDGDVPADTAGCALHERRAARRERLGLPPGGWGQVAERLRHGITLRGGVFWSEMERPRLALTPAGVLLEGRTALHVRAAVSTLPWSDLSTWSGWSSRPDLGRRQSLTSVCVVTRRAELDTYRLRLPAGAAFAECIRTDPLLGACAGGRRILYLARLRPTGVPQEAEDVVAKQALTLLEELAPGFDPDGVESVRVTTAPGIERIPRLGDMRARFFERVAQSRLFLSSCEQVHPRRPGIETSILMAREAAQSLRPLFA